jgi:hypothetical protein
MFHVHRSTLEDPLPLGPSPLALALASTDIWEEKPWICYRAEWSEARRNSPVAITNGQAGYSMSGNICSRSCRPVVAKDWQSETVSNWHGTIDCDCHTDGPTAIVPSLPQDLLLIA